MVICFVFYKDFGQIWGKKEKPLEIADLVVEFFSSFVLNLQTL